MESKVLPKQILYKDLEDPTNSDPTNLEPTNLDLINLEPTNLDLINLDPTNLDLINMDPTNLELIKLDPNNLDSNEPQNDIDKPRNLFKVSANSKKQSSSLTKMALSLAMNLSGLERLFFYELGAQEMYDASEKLMACTPTTSQENHYHHNNNDHYGNQSTALMNLLCKSKTPNSSSTAAVPTITNKHHTALISPDSIVSPGSTSSGGFISESEMNGSAAQAAPVFNMPNMLLPPPQQSPYNNHPIAVQQPIVQEPDYSWCQFLSAHGQPDPTFGESTQKTLDKGRLPLMDFPSTNYEESATTSMMANYIAPSIVQEQENRFAPIGTKRSRSPIRAITSSESHQSNNVLTPPPSSIITQKQYTTTAIDYIPQTLAIYGISDIWSSYQEPKPLEVTQPKDEIIYGNRDILNLAGNLKDDNWQYRPAHLPMGDGKFYFENRSQYHRLATAYDEKPDDEIIWECSECHFFLPIVLRKQK